MNGGKITETEGIMQSFIDLVCSDCGKKFHYASSMLKHFAEHVFEASRNKCIMKKNELPDLYPISSRRSMEKSDEASKGEGDPMNYCEVSVIEDVDGEILLNNSNAKSYRMKNEICDQEKRYKCQFCVKSFGWPTDLKRHVLVHTGERPYSCNICQASFTRNFLLQKHLKKIHHKNDKFFKIPDLKPISSLHTLKKKIKSRKQDKRNIRKKSTQINKFIMTNVLCK